MKPRLLLWIIVLLTLVTIFVDLPKLSFDTRNISGRFPLKLGLDLQGGTQLVLETKMDNIDEGKRDQALESARTVIERRVNLFGVSEAVVQTSKLGSSRRILVDLPGVSDASSAANLVGRTAQLEFRELEASPSAQATSSAALKSDSSQALLITLETTKLTGLTGADLKKSQVAFASTGGKSGPGVEVEFTSEGTKKFAQISKRNIGRQLPIFLDEVVVSAPVVEQEIIGTALISGGFTTEEAKRLSIQLNAGALPVPIQILEQRSIGATLGAESVSKSLIAGSIGLLTVLVYMAAYYGWWGAVANLALIIYSLFALAIFKTGLFLIPPVTLTLAGIAGFILSIGMAVDANILIFERMKEEKRWGKPARQALELGFDRAWSSIRDSNISTLMTAAILYGLGTGPVKGFALTLAIGVLVSMFTAITVTRTFLRLMVRGS